MNIIDAVIILLILAAGVVGLKRGLFKELVLTVGLLLVYIISFKLKNPIANFLSYNFPFFQFAGTFEGATSLNIIMYQTIAFILVFSIIMIIFRVVLSFTGALEKVLNFTIILGIPSKIGGFIVGLIEGFIVVYMLLFIISQPFLKIDIVQQSKFREKILTSSPILSSVANNTNKAVNEIYELQKTFIKDKDLDYFNSRTIEILLEHDVINDEYVEKLRDMGKI